MRLWFYRLCYRNRERRAVRFLGWLGTGWRRVPFAAACVLLGLLFVLSAALPFEPLDLRSVSTKPPLVCPGEGVAVTVDRDWQRPGLFSEATRVRSFSTWENVRTGERYPVAPSPWDKPMAPPYGGAVTGDQLRPAPQEPGTYRLLTRYDVEGRSGILGGSQGVPSEDPAEFLPATNTLEVSPCDA